MKREEKEEIYELFEDLKDEEISEQKIEDAKKKASFLGEMSSNFMLLINMILDYWNGDFDIPKTDLILIIGAISYVVLPFDTIPDILPIVGYTDDILVVGLVVKKLSNLISRYKRQKNK